ncbi:MAG: haloacid dehalogenase-like hydrolase [Roseburia sp.]|nr:haloacid dehalogenase-like hydrolase [Anaeroplasma bactoclasticum]MCM1196337.1 haloacid dehalogenase-like hydrolase [Roseburia sp.]MCM1556486.1 haloacid dehalogenase-like hydrolase [Anaeroplasma bactoclasticum]
MAKTTIGIMYDFDKTLCTTDMQNYAFIKNLGMEPEEFWNKASINTKKNSMDKILSYMFVMIEECKKKGIPLTEEYLNSLGSEIIYYRGVQTWFDRINQFGAELGVNIEHYIISSGTKEIIEGSAIAKYFKKIYGCKFIYDTHTKEAIWPGIAINYTQKTQYIFRISKGALDEVDEEKLNMEIADERRAIQYRNMIYIGDGLTDIPCMQLLKDKGGKSIALYQPQYIDKVLPLVDDGRVNYVCAADYSTNSNLEKIVKLMIENMSMLETLRNKEERQLQSITKLLGDKNDN